MPVILADEMDAEWREGQVVPAPPNDKLYGNPASAASSTPRVARRSGAISTPAAVRRAGALRPDGQCRAPLERAASELTTEPGVVLHEKSGRSIGYGEIAAFAKVPDKAPEVGIEPVGKAQFRLIGKDVPRVDVPARPTVPRTTASTCRFRAWSTARSCASRSKARRRKASTTRRTRAIEGVIDVVPLEYGVGVLAHEPWVAFKAKNALKVDVEPQGARLGALQRAGLRALRGGRERPATARASRGRREATCTRR